MVRYKTGLLFLVFAVAAFLVLTSSYKPAGGDFHTKEELEAFRHSRSNIIDSGEYFLGSTNCKGCHGYDSLQIASLDESGNDVNVYDDWESTMMAFSAKDPFWRAKVSHEILVNPGHSDELQTKCTSCHAPMGHYTAIYKGATHYTLADLLTDTLGLNGVACGACHSIADDSLGLQFSGIINYDTNNVEYGPFQDPVVGPMMLYVGITPTYSPHVSRSQVCASCHTLVTKTIDLNGNYTGGHFVEQATFHEWLNSTYNDDQPCQGCHMPQLQEPVVIANDILNLPPRSPFNQHQFMGSNSFMLNLIKQNKNSLDIDVEDRHIDSTIAATLRLLRHSTIEMATRIDSITSDTMYVSVELANKAGHKFPSGYPSRRAYVQFAVTNGNDTIFQSGMLRPDYEVTGQGAQVEPHFNVISDSTQAQIYEMVMGDVNGNITTVLARASSFLKDNRIPPAGFTTNHSVYDTVPIVGDALTDADFNRSPNGQGTGKDVVHYHIPLRGNSGAFHVAAAMYYQVLPPRWLTEMFSYSSDFIDSFKVMYLSADKTPVLIAQSERDTNFVVQSARGLSKETGIGVFPIPSADGNLIVESADNSVISSIEIWDVAGKKVKEVSFKQALSVFNLLLPETSGIYYLRISTNKGQVIRKVVR